MSNVAIHPSAIHMTSRARVRAAHPSHLRLTRRGRLVVSVAAFALAGASIGVGQAVIATDQPGAPIETIAVQVQPGETLWDIASRVHPGGDVRDTVAEIAELNAVDNPAALQMGSTILVPVYSK